MGQGVARAAAEGGRNLGGSGGMPPPGKLDPQRWLLECSDCTTGVTKNDVSPHRNEETDSPRTIALGRTAPLFETFSSERQRFCRDEMAPWPRAMLSKTRTYVRTNRPSSMRMRSSERAIFSL